jgi:ribonuclease HI
MSVIALYTDGGVVLRNPSSIGGTWAWCGVDEKYERVCCESGLVLAPSGRTLSNNVMEYVAVVRALEAMPDGWSGILYSDSMVTLGRIFRGWKLRKLPANAIQRAGAALARLGTLTPVLVKGHPSRAELEQGIAVGGLPVSGHNRWCDQECSRLARQCVAEQEERRTA